MSSSAALAVSVATRLYFDQHKNGISVYMCSPRMLGPYHDMLLLKGQPFDKEISERFACAICRYRKHIVHSRQAPADTGHVHKLTLGRLLRSSQQRKHGPEQFQLTVRIDIDEALDILSCHLDEFRALNRHARIGDNCVKAIQFVFRCQRFDTASDRIRRRDIDLDEKKLGTRRLWQRLQRLSSCNITNCCYNGSVCATKICAYKTLTNAWRCNVSISKQFSMKENSDEPRFAPVMRTVVVDDIFRSI